MRGENLVRRIHEGLRELFLAFSGFQIALVALSAVLIFAFVNDDRFRHLYGDVEFMFASLVLLTAGFCSGLGIANFRNKRRVHSQTSEMMNQPCLKPDGSLRLQGDVDSASSGQSDQLKIAEAYQASEMRFRKLIDHSWDAFLCIDEQGKFNYASGAVTRVWGYSAEELMGVVAFDLVHEEERDQAMLSIMRILQQPGMTESIRYRARKKTGEYAWAESVATNLLHDPYVGAIIINIHDISEEVRIKMELNEAKVRAEEANEAKSQFLANMSHEIRTPLGAILGFTDLILDPTIADEERRRYSEVVKRNGAQLSSLIKDILDLSKIEADRLEIESVPVSVPNIAEEVIGTLWGVAEKKGVRLCLEPWENLPELIWSDPTRLRQIITNLVGNAIKFTHQGKVTIFIHGEIDRESKKPFVMVDVADNGIGISPEQSRYLFKRFSQADPSMTRTHGGTGLGLSLSKALAELMGGDLVLVKSEPGKGSTFRASFPAIPAEERSGGLYKEESTHDAPLAEHLPLKGVRILLAEDSADNQLLIRKYLEGEGAQIEFANDGLEAVNKAFESSYDLILMDIQMPRMSGYDATKALRSHGYSKPIIALTAHALREEREKSLEYGCDAHLTKPINRKELVQFVSDLYKKHPRMDHSGAHIEL